MAELATLPRCFAVELCEVGFAAAVVVDVVVVVAAARYDSRSRRSGNAQKDALNGNFAALGDNWALRRHVIIPATAGALLKLPEFMESAGESERSGASELAELFSFRTTLMAPLFRRPDGSASLSRPRFNLEDERSLPTK